MKKSIRIIFLCCLLTAPNPVKGEEIHTAKLEGEQFFFRVLHRDDSFKISLTGSGREPEAIEPRLSLEYGPLSMGHLLKRGMLGELDTPFSASITSALFDEVPGFKGDFSMRPSSRYGVVFSPFSGSGVALIRETENLGLWGWASVPSGPDMGIQPFFVFSGSEPSVGDVLQEEYPLRVSSGPLLYSGINLSLRENEAGFDLLFSSRTSETGLPGGFARFRVYRNLEFRNKTRIDSVLMGRRVFGNYTDFQGDFIEEEADLWLKTGIFLRRLKLVFGGELRRWKSPPVPQRYIPFERRFISEVSLGEEKISAQVGLDLQMTADVAGTNGMNLKKWLGMGIKLERFRCEVEYERDEGGGGEIEEVLQGVAGFEMEPFRLDVRVSTGRYGRVRVDVEPGLEGVDSAFFIIESSSTATADSKIEISLGWSCSIETGSPRRG